jgi:signal transduction histidine kinase
VARLGFRARLLLILALFAAIPAVVVTVGWAWAFTEVVPLVSGSANWNQVASTGAAAINAARAAPLSASQRAALDAHEAQLSASVTNARRVEYLTPRVALLLIGGAAIGLVLLAWPAWRVGGHLSRQLSRPLDDLVGWTQAIARGAPLPPPSDVRGAPEFDVLRRGMRSMAAELEAARARAVEAERLRAFRESSRRFAHELKNPLTPIRFAIARLRRDAAPDLQETIGVLAVEADRLDAMARSFAQFGRLPEGPAAEVDIGDLVTYTARASVPERLALTLDVPEPMSVRGHHDTLARALSNVLLNAVDACADQGRITVTVRRDTLRDASAVRIAVSDTGVGIAPEKLAGIWEPYVTEKPGGTGLGLAIARQAVESHGGEVFATSTPGNTEIGFVLPMNAGLPAITGEWHAN